METINDRFRLLRESTGLSQEEFASKAHRTRSEIKNIEYGKTTPKEEVIASICHTYGISEEWLRHGLEPMRAAKSEEEEIAELVSSALSGSSRLKKAVIKMICSKSDKELEALEAMLRQLYESLDK
jgi:transcriptional regulator with XRE-family HTH domain